MNNEISVIIKLNVKTKMTLNEIVADAIIK